MTISPPTRHAEGVDSDQPPSGEPDRPEFSVPGLPGPPAGAQAGRRTRPEIVYLDPHADRPVSQYSPEGEIRMMGDFAAGLARRNNVSRPMAFALVAIVLLPIIVTVIAVISSWL
ncbi:hypothetical protein BH10ACT8_BH10ACT8_17770 [soil metagenome]